MILAVFYIGCSDTLTRSINHYQKSSRDCLLHHISNLALVPAASIQQLGDKCQHPTLLEVTTLPSAGSTTWEGSQVPATAPHEAGE